MMKSTALLKRFEDKFPLIYFFVTGIGGGSLFVFLMRWAYIFLISPESGSAFDCVTVIVATWWIIWRAFKYAFR